MYASCRMSACLVILGSLSCAQPVRVLAGQTGAELYDQECADCHSLAKPPKNKKGPTLVGIMGKSAASVPNFAYSGALISAAIVWNAANMDAYIKDPKVLVPGGGKMKYDGLKNSSERAAIVEFLSQQR